MLLSLPGLSLLRQVKISVVQAAHSFTLTKFYCYWSLYADHMFSQGLVTLPRLWSPTLQCLILWSKHGPSSTCSRPSVPRSHGPAAGTPGTQVPVHTNVHVCITAAQQALVLGFAWHLIQCYFMFYWLIDWYIHIWFVFFPQSFVWSLAKKMSHPTWRCLWMQLHLPQNSGSKCNLLFCSNGIRKEVSKSLSGFSLSLSGLFHSVLFCQIIWKILNRYGLL